MSIIFIALIAIACLIIGYSIRYLQQDVKDRQRMITELKAQLDKIEQAQREQRLPYAVAEDTEDIIAIQARATRQLREVKQTINDLGLFLEAMANETERTANKARQIRGNGQKSQKGK